VLSSSRRETMSQPELSAYEMERAENIRRNNMRLQQLGLEQQPLATSGMPVHPKRSRRPDNATPLDESQLRRSSRSRGAPVLYTEVEVHVPKRGPAVRPAEETWAADAESDALDATAPREIPRALLGGDDRPPAEPGFARATDIAVAAVVSAHLGAHIPGAPTKASVVAMLAGGSVRFSKYSGALEWRNAVVLWVNVGGQDYNNVFLDDGARMTWFASAASHEDSPTIRRLIGSGAIADEGSRAAVLLFCRLPSEQYICCGRLTYVKHDASKHPLKFVWALADFEQLRQSEAFRGLLAMGK